MSSNPASTAASAARDNEKWVLIVTITASSMAFISQTALNIALPAIQESLNVSGAGLLWIINAYALMLAALILVGGSLGDHLGRVKIFRYGVIIATVASALAGFAPNAEFLIAMRVVQGIGGALLIPGSLAILSASVAPERRGMAIGTWSMFVSLMQVLGPIFGGFLASAGLWRGVFFFNLPLAAVVLLLLPRVPESRDEHAPAQLDYTGAGLVTLGLGGITFAFIQGDALGWTSPAILGTLMGGILALVAFVVWEGYTDHPMMPLGLFKSRTFAGANLLTLSLYGALSGFLFFFPLLLVQVQGYDESEAGFVLLPFSLLLVVMSRWAGRWMDRVGARLPLTLGPFITGIGFVLFTLPGLTDGISDYFTSYFPAIMVTGVGMGITVAPLTTAVMSAAPPDQSGTASGINNAVSRTAGVLAIAILGGIGLVLFRTALLDGVASLNLPTEAVTTIEDRAADLAAAEPPATLAQAEQDAVAQAVKLAFIDMFRQMGYIAAGMSWLSALSAWLMIEPRPAESVISAEAVE